MRAPVLLTLLNSLRKRDKMLGKSRILSLFLTTRLINSINMSTHVRSSMSMYQDAWQVAPVLASLHGCYSIVDALRSCRRDKSGYYTEDHCKKTVLGDHRCFCFSDWCNGKEQDAKFNEFLASQIGSGTTKRPASRSVSLRMSGVAVLGVVILTL